ncbi:ABC transporter permease [Roseofilum capinflatum]|uniref:ABC-2 family transporter protein n=1 Tax=Roseofilum capinflatum BLCC-M114 TaxID=3022440 RepID=A0ABT7B7Q3_9CYAN|nr:ABC-2 family transporter protein [Roseofilum capinflatum]MDJ1175202.1 ABC-2 family transporter protein [Roseofilum capinflatum BLCC-M114]
MKFILKKTQTFLDTYYAHMVEYRAELFLWAISNSLPFILMGVWIEAANNADFGLSSLEFGRYFFSVFLVRQLALVWVIWEFEEQVVKGQLSPRLLQPIDPVAHYLARHIAERLARIPFTIGLVLLFFLLYPQAFWIPSWQQILSFLIFTQIVFLVRFVIQYTFALFSFWTERASALEQFWSLLYVFLSGIIAPLQVFPPVIQEILWWTPFPYLVNFPASVLVGLPVNWGRALCTLIGWGLIFYAANRWLWRKGLKHYSGMGA